MQRRVLVTGANRGIGRASALELARAGFALTLNYRANEGQAREAAEAIAREGGEARVLAFDVADREMTRVALEDDAKTHGPYYGIVLNAGVNADGLFVASRDEHWDRVLRTNLDGFFNVLRPLVPSMAEARQGGRVVVLSSVAGVTGNRGQVSYSASKAGLIGATRSLALELARRDITVNCVAPGFTATDMIAGFPVEKIAELVPLRRAARAEEVAALIAFLLSERAGYITGQCLSIDGGLSV